MAQSIWSGKVLTGRDASLANFASAAPSARIIHLATHGKADDRVGANSFIAFANNGVPTPSDPADTLWVRDLFQYDLPADLLILSACETGIGEVKAGEGVIGLSNGFAQAGVRSLLSTLWLVDDAAIAWLMTTYLQELHTGRAKDLALREAKLALLAERPEWCHPAYWAAPVQQGSLQPLVTPWYRQPLTGAAAGGLTLLLAGWWWRRRRAA